MFTKNVQEDPKDLNPLKNIDVWFRNLKIAKKELALVAVMAIFLILVGLIGYYFNYKANKRIEEIYYNRLLSIAYLDKVKENTRINIFLVQRMFYAENPEQAKKTARDIRHRSKLWKEYLNLYITTGSDKFEQQRIPALRTDASIVTIQRDKTINKIINGDHDQAYLYFQHYIFTTNKFNNDVSVLTDYNIKRAKLDYKKNLKSIRIANLWILCSILLSLMLAIPLGLFIARLIADPLSNIVDRMKEVTGGNLSPPYAKISTADEIGEVNNAFNTMTNNLRDSINKEKSIREREEFLRSIILASISTLQTNQVLKTVVVEIGKRFNASRAYFIKYDNVNDKFLPVQDYEVYISSFEYKDLTGKTIEKDELEPFLKILLNQKQALTINNVTKIDLPEKTRNFLEEYDIKSFIATPVLFQNKPIGILMVDFNTPDKEFLKDEVDLFISIANQSAIIIHQTQLFHEVQSSRDRADKLRRIISSFTGALDLQETLERISRETAELFNAERIFLTQFPDKKDFNKWTIRNDYINSPQMISSEHVELDTRAGEYWGDFIFNKGKILAIDDISTSDIPEPLRNNLKMLGIRAIAAFPIKKDDEIWGTLSIAMSHPKKWTDEELSLIIPISDQIYLVIKQAELYEVANKNAEREALLRRIIETIRGSLDINETIKIICDETANLFNADRAVIIEFPDRKNYENWITKREYLKSSSIKSFKDVDFDSRIGTFWGTNILDNGKPLTINNIQKSNCPDYLKESYNRIGINAIVFVPIQKEYDKWGVLGLSTVKARIWTDADIALLESIADQIYLAIKQAELYSITKEQGERSELIRKIIGTIGESLDLNKVVDSICYEIMSDFKVDRTAIEIFVPKSDYSEWNVTGEAKSSDDVLGAKDIDYPRESKMYIGTRLLEDNRDIVAYDIKKYDFPDHFVDTHKKMDVKSLIGVPIKSGDNKIGVLVLAQVHSYRHWSDEEVKLLHSIADQAYIAIRQAELYSRTKESEERENLLRSINNKILQSNSLDEAVNYICKEIGSLLNIDRASIRFFDPVYKNFTEIKGEYRRNENISSTVGIIYPKEVNEYFVRKFGENKKIMAVNDVNDTNIPEVLQKAAKILNVRSTVVAPIVYRDTLLALLFLTNTDTPTNWSTKNIEIVQSLTQQIALGINLFQTAEKLTKSLDTEKMVRDFILNIRNMKDHKEIFDYLLRKLSDVFKVQRSLHIHYDENDNMIVDSEFITDGLGIKPLLNQYILQPEHTHELTPKTFSDTIVVDDVNTEINDSELKEYLKNNDIQSFIVYPRSSRYSGAVQEKIFATTILCSTHPRKWSASEIDSYRLIIDASSLVLFEILQRKETDETRNTFLATLTHDLRSPINAEQKALEVILAKRLGTSLEGFSEYLEDIYKTNQELLRIVDNILSVYHYEEGKFELKLEEANIAELINFSVSSMRPLAKDQDSNINTNIDPDLPLAMADKDEILRVVNNLVSNAIKHNKRGTTINISATASNGEVKVSVRDNGKGIPEEEKKNIFQRYPTTKRKIGTGLGLYLSKQIIDAHNGKIWFDTEVGKGTTFSFTLPLA